MSVLSMIYSFFLMPIQLIFEVIFSYAYRFTSENTGLSIILLSLAFNLLVLPLYRRSDAIQEEERNIEAKLHDGVQHIKKTFKGDERTMMIQTYYRQNNYSPLYVLRSAISLFLAIPFFIVAYRFLSSLPQLHGASFGPIADLGVPDGLLTIGGLTINVLPIIMTAVNVISTIIFTKGYPPKTKIQLYGMAAFFLIFLYNSPSGLVFYWTLNNVFSLIKTIFYKIKNPKKVLNILLLCIGILMFGFSIIKGFSGGPVKWMILLGIVGLALCIPFVYTQIKAKTKFSFPDIKAQPNTKLFIGGALFLSMLTGVLIPSSVITASPQEFVIVGHFVHPVWYIVNTFLVSAGLFILWFGVFYWLFAPKAKVVFERIIIAACGVGVVDYLLFSNNLGVLSTELVYDNDPKWSIGFILLNLLAVCVVAAGLIVLTKFKPKIVFPIVMVASLTMLCMGVINSVGIFNSVAELSQDSISSSSSQPTIKLSKEGKNVVVLMLDRAMGEYIPYIMKDNPELEKDFAGFTYYSNVISYGGHTNFGTPSLFGGYEYTPVEINRKKDQTLVEKQNEALKVLPVMYDNEGYDSTVIDPPYAGYKHIPDLSIYKDYPNIDKYIANGYFTDLESVEQLISNRNRNFFWFGITKMTPLFAQSTIYDEGNYHHVTKTEAAEKDAFDDAYGVLKNMSEMTKISNNKKGSFLMMASEATHNSKLFKDSDYLVVDDSVNTTPEPQNKTLNGITLQLETKKQIGTYQTNIAAYTRLTEWFDYLKKEGVYDNTKIILVSDHGFGLDQIVNFFLDDTVNDKNIDKRYGDAEFYFPLLMVKDFNSKDGFKTSNEFMANADVATIATKDTVNNPVNPFTKKVINDKEKTAHDQYIIASKDFSITKNRAYYTQFLPGRWYSVHDDIWNKDNWSLVAENEKIKDYK